MTGSASRPLPRSYSDLAHLWPALSPVEHYESEAALVQHVLDTWCSVQIPCLLDLGAGGGHVLYHLPPEYPMVAVDLSEPMLEHCRALNPHVECVVGDMRTVRLGREFDAVLLHDSIDYMLTAEDALAALVTAVAHVPKGGIVLVAPTYVKDEFEDGEHCEDSATTDEFDVVYLTYVHDPDPSDTTFEMVLVYLLRSRATRQVEVVEDRHVCGLFSKAEWLQLLERAGCDAELYEPPQLETAESPNWTILVGRRR